jgi:DNA-binding NtrC family response regulator
VHHDGVTARCSLVIARDAGLAWALVRLLARHGLAAFDGGDDVQDALSGRFRYPVAGVLVDAGLLGDDPAAAVTALRTLYDEPVVVVMSGGPDHPALPPAERAGAVPLTASFVEAELVELLGGRGGAGGDAGVREPRRPRPPAGTLAAARPLPVADGG